MKILQVMAGNDHGGAETAFVDMCLAMQEAGMDIEVVTRDNPVRIPMLRDAGIKVHTLPFGGAIDVFTTWRLDKIIKDFSPHIVQTWMARASQKTSNWSVLKSPQRYLVVSRLGGYYKKKYFKSADYFVTNTPDIKRYLVGEGIADDKIRHINNFAKSEDEKISVLNRSEFDTPDDAPLAICLGRLHDSKAHDITLKSMVDVPELYVWIAGEGPLRDELEAMAKDLGVASRVRFLGWRTDRGALFNAADICVFPSRFEPFGNVFVQAWAANIPVIVSDADGPKQFCKDGIDSLIVPKDDYPALSTAIKKLLADNDLQKKLVSNGYQRYLDEFTKEKCVSSYHEFFIDILKRENIF